MADNVSALQDEHIKYQKEQLGKQEEQLEKDVLTGLKNRVFFENELERALKAIRVKKGHHRASGEPLRELSVLFIDLDNFKQVNDIHGHPKGDIVLKKVAEILTGSVREGDVVARFGGDEFYVFLPRANGFDAAVIAEKIRANLEGDPMLKEPPGVTASIGVRSVNASNIADSKTLIKQADEALYEAKGDKEKGRNRVRVYSGQ